jgi:hypothetical protein
MPETIRSVVQASVDGGPSLSATPSIQVDAYDKLSVVVGAADGATPGEAIVDVQPATAAKVELLMVTSSRYDDTELTYTVGSRAVELDTAHLFSGAMVKLFDSDPKQITITNKLDTPVTISVLVGRTVN